MADVFRISFEKAHVLIRKGHPDLVTLYSDEFSATFPKDPCVPDYECLEVRTEHGYGKKWVERNFMGLAVEVTDLR